MQDRTPKIVDPGTRSTSYTGDYASVLLRVVRRSPKGVSVDVLMGAVGVVSSHDQTFPDFVDAVDYLHDCGLIGSEEYDALPDDEKHLDLKQIWKLLP